MSGYITVIPRRFILESGDVVVLTARDVEEKLTRDTVFRLWVPDVDAVHEYLTSKQGFETATPSAYKGERYSLRKVLTDIWELHLQLYSDGFIDAEVEVGREYLEHPTSRRLNVVYEAFEYYRGVYDKLHLWYVPAGKWVVKVIDHLNVKLREPDTLTPWKPIVLGIVVAGLFAYALSRLAKGGRQ